MAKELDSNNEISISGELTGNGFSAKVKSRAVSAWDRFWGSKADKKSAPIEAEAAEIKAASNARVKILEALGDLGVARLKSDPEFAARAVENFLPRILRQQENKDAVLELALEDLRHAPPAEKDKGPEELDESFLNRFERYAEEASSDQLRERWGKVLASEIRKPGTFSGKVLRLIDEIDPTTATLFEKFCQHRLEDVVPKQLVGGLSFDNQARLVEASLILDPGVGQLGLADEANDNNGTTLWMWRYGQAGLALVARDNPPQAKEMFLQYNKKQLGLPIYVLTDAGHAISSILPNAPDRTVDQLVAGLAEAYPEEVFRRYRREGNEWRQV